MTHRVLCDVCEGTGRERIEGERTMVCHNGCDNGYFDAEPRDFDGRRVRYEKFRLGYAELMAGRLVMLTDDGFYIVGLDLSNLEIIDG